MKVVRSQKTGVRSQKSEVRRQKYKWWLDYKQIDTGYEMTEQEIIKLTNQVFEDSFEIEKELLKEEMNIFQDLGLDSLDIVDLVVALQEKFGVKIRNDERIKGIRTLGDIYKFIISLKAEGASPAALGAVIK